MKKNLLFLFMVLFTLGFISCNDSDDTYFITDTDLNGAYLGELNVSAPFGGIELGDSNIVQKVYITKTGENRVKLELKNFTFKGFQIGTIEVSDMVVEKSDNLYHLAGNGNLDLIVGPCAVVVSGTISENGKCDLKIGVNVVGAGEEGNFTGLIVNVDFAGNKLSVDQNSEALIKSFNFNSDSILNVEVSDNSIIFYILDSTQNLNFAPSIEVSAGAKITPASGVSQDFTNDVTYTVTSEDGVTTTQYVVKRAGKVMLYSFDKWAEKGNYSDPVENGWATSNQAAVFLSSLWDGGPFPVSIAENGYKNKAVTLYSADTKGVWMLIAAVPKVTAGSLFLGKFKINLSNTLKSTLFGVPFYAKPLRVKGYYKYSAGDIYCTTIIDGKNVSADTISGKQDSCSLTAVLYEVPDYSDEMTLNGISLFDFSQAPTGVKVVAEAQFYSYNQPEFTPFELNLTYNELYDPAKKYKFAVIFSPSKNGAKFEGCPGSLLTIDEVEIITE